MQTEDKPGLPPITLPEGKRTEGTLLAVPVKRIVKKSSALKAIEKKVAKAQAEKLQRKTEANVAYGRFVKGQK